MKLKSIIALILTILFLLSSCPGVCATDFIENGSFEETFRGVPRHWELSGGAVTETTLRPTLGGNLVENGGFEIATGNEPTDWRAYWGPWNGSYLKRVNTTVRSGSYAVSILGNANDGMVAMYTVNGIIPLSQYQATAWVYIDAGASTRGTSISASFYTVGGTHLGNAYAARYTSPLRRWTQIVFNFEAPADCGYLVLNLNAADAGVTTYFDDIELYKTVLPQKYTLETDDIFHYADVETGKAEVILSDAYDSTEERNTRVNFAISEDGVVKKAANNVAFSADRATFHYTTAFMELDKEYLLTATVTNGTFSQTFTEEIYKVNRPSALGTDGVYRVNGEPFLPVIAYWPGEYARLPEMGITVAEIGAYSVEQTTTTLNQLEALGLKALVSLYCGPNFGKPAGHPDNMVHTMEILKAVATHPAVFAYALQDEPYLYSGKDDMDEWLKSSYRIVRKMDSVHPIYLVDIEKSLYKQAGKMTDILAVDAYPYSTNSMVVSTGVQLAREAVQSKKPVYSIVQSYEGTGWFPTADNIREQLFRAIEGGAKGIGFYTIAKAIGQGTMAGVQALYETDRWEPLCYAMEKEVLPIMQYFTLGDGTQFCKSADGGPLDFFYEAWVKDGSIYLLAHNRGTSSVNTTVQLKSGSYTVNSYKLQNISENTVAVTAYGSALDISLAAQKAVFYKIVPNNAITLSALSVSLYETAENYVYISLPVVGAQARQTITGLQDNSMYVLSARIRSGKTNSGTLTIEYLVEEDAVYYPYADWCEKNEIKATALSTVEYIGSIGDTAWRDVSFECAIPEHVTVARIAFTARVVDEYLAIDDVSMQRIGAFNMIKNGSFEYTRGDGMLTGGWTAYNLYAANGNTVALESDAGGNTWLTMSEAPAGSGKPAANARQSTVLAKDTVYKLQFDYKNTIATEDPTVCLFDSSGKGHTLHTWNRIKNTSWQTFTTLLYPTKDDTFSLWFGGTAARGTYSFDNITLLPYNDAQAGFFGSAVTSTTGDVGPALLPVQSIAEIPGSAGTRTVTAATFTPGIRILLAGYQNATCTDIKISAEGIVELALSENCTTLEAYTWKNNTMQPVAGKMELR